MLSRIQAMVLCSFMIMAIVACTSDTPQSENNSDDSTATTVLNEVPNLRESYTWSNIFTDSAISVDYPSGWFIEARGEQLLITSIDPDTLESDSDALIINVLPAEGDMLLEGTDTTPESLLELAFLDSLGEVDEITTTTINDYPSAYTSGEFEGNSSRIYAIQFDEGFFIVIIAIKAQPLTAIEEELIVSIVESLRYEVGILNPSDE